MISLTVNERTIFNFNKKNKITILAEGDSWFAYPKQFFLFGEGSNILDYLSERKNLISKF